MKTVLIVDDDEIVLRLAAHAIRWLGVDVLRASNGIEAMSLLSSSQHVGLVLSDIQMPHMTGIELYQAMVKDDRTKVIPLVLMTGGGATTLAMVPPGLLVLQKPFSPVSVRCIVVSHLGGTCPSGRLEAGVDCTAERKPRSHQPLQPGHQPQYCMDPCDTCMGQASGKCER